MKFKIEKSKLIFWAVAAVVVLPRLFLIFVGYPYIFPEGHATLDDELMYNAAKSILEGNWLGEYGAFTMAKNMFFSVYLAVIHILGIPYLVAGQILFILAATFFTTALFPVVKGRYKRLAVFAICAYNPIAFSDYTNRVYRDNIYPALVLFVFAAIIGIALRYKGKLRNLIFYAVVGGITLGCAYLTREDGIWLMPFVICGILATILFVIFDKDCRKKIGKIAIATLPVLLMGAILAIYAATNYHHYGRFVINDLSAPEFEGAYGQMLRIEKEEYSPVFPLDSEDREKLYDASPALTEIWEGIEGMVTWKKTTPEGELEFSNGAFYWALREAAHNEGYYKDAKTAQEYWERVETELADAYDSGVLEAKYSPSPSLTLPFDTEVLPLLFHETISSAKSILLYENFFYKPTLIIPLEDNMLEQFEFLNTEPILDASTGEEITEIIGWAFLTDGHIDDVKVLDSKGNLVQFNIIQRESSDISEHFYALLGIDQKYSENSRFEIDADIPHGEDFSIELYSGSEKYIIDIAQEISVQESENFIASIESVENVYSPQPADSYRKIAYSILDFVIALYRFLTLPLIILSLIAIFYKFNIKKNGLIYLILLGIALSAVLRILMVSYVEVTAFDIGTYRMYLASVYPLVYAFIALSLGSLMKFDTEKWMIKFRGLLKRREIR